MHLAIITPYPEGGTYTHTKSALASFCANLVEAMIKIRSDLQISIMADKLDNSKAHHSPQKDSSHEKINILRIWNRHDSFVYVRLFSAIKRLTPTHLLLQLEWNLFGGPRYLIALPLFLLSMRFLGIKTYVVTHGVMVHKEPDVDAITIGFAQIFYRLLSVSSHRLIVLEEALKENLISIGLPASKIVFIPHGVDTNLSPMKNTALSHDYHEPKYSPNTFILVFFGFLAPYKNPDGLLDLFIKSYCLDQRQKNIALWFVGGPTQHRNDHEYKAYIDAFITKMKEYEPKIYITGFVAQEDMSYFLTRADCMIFPHKMFISSSGPLSIAFSYQKPILMARTLLSYTKSPDIAQHLYEAKLKEDDIFFAMNEADFRDKVEKVRKDTRVYTHFSSLMREARSWDVIARKYLEVVLQ